MNNLSSTNINRETLAKVAAEAIARINPNAENGKRWINAIAKSVVEIENNPFISFDFDSHSLLILSDKSGEIYTANGTCQCKAFAQGKPCYHRAAARLVVRYLETAQ
jgi:hypothetical protein